MANETMQQAVDPLEKAREVTRARREYEECEPGKNRELLARRLEELNRS